MKNKNDLFMLFIFLLHSYTADWFSSDSTLLSVFNDFNFRVIDLATVFSSSFIYTVAPGPLQFCFSLLPMQLK